MSGRGRRIDVLSYGNLADVTDAPSVSVTTRQLASLRAHPLAISSDPALVLLRRDDRVVGRIGLIPGVLRVGARDHRVFYATDWRVDPDERVDGAGGSLLLQAVRLARSMVNFGVSAEALPVLRAARFTVASVPRHALLLRSRPWLRRRAAALGIFAPFVDLVLARTGAALHARGGTGLRVTLVPRFDAVIDGLDSARGVVRLVRDHRELNWAIEHPWLGPGEGYATRAFIGKFNGQPVGFALARLRRFGEARHGTILRFAAPPEHARPLLAYVLAALRAEGADLVEITTSAAIAAHAARSLGMRPRKGMELLTKLAPEVLADIEAVGMMPEGIPADSGEADLLLW